MDESLRAENQSVQEAIGALDRAMVQLDVKLAALDRSQLFFDLVGVGLTAVAVMLGILAIVQFFVSKVAAREAAEEVTRKYLEDAENTEKAVHDWLDANWTRIVSAIEVHSATRQRQGSLPDGYDDAYDADDLAGIPDDGGGD